MPKISNPLYAQFLKEASMDMVDIEHITKALNNIKGRNTPQARALLLTLYYTGARPNEVLRMRAGDITKQGNTAHVRIPGSKGGFTRTVELSFSRRYVKELYEYATSLPPGLYLFHSFLGRYVRSYTKKDGTVMESKELSRRLRHHLQKWFKDVLKPGLTITPYYLRHNRTTLWMDSGATVEDVMLMRGGRRYENVMRYRHMSSKLRKKMSRLTR